MRILGCGLVAVAVLLGPAPVAMADESIGTGESAGTSFPADTRPPIEVSMLAVSVTAGGAVAMAGSGLALAVARRRAGGQPPVQ